MDPIRDIDAFINRITFGLPPLQNFTLEDLDKELDSAIASIDEPRVAEPARVRPRTAFTSALVIEPPIATTSRAPPIATHLNAPPIATTSEEVITEPLIATTSNALAIATISNALPIATASEEVIIEPPTATTSKKVSEPPRTTRVRSPKPGGFLSRPIIKIIGHECRKQTEGVFFKVIREGPAIAHWVKDIDIETNENQEAIKSYIQGLGTSRRLTFLLDRLPTFERFIQ